MLEQPQAKDYIIATGTSHTPTEFVATAFELARRDWREHTTVSKQLILPTDVATVKLDIPKSLGEKVGRRDRT
jgi:GDPmannose 4,6-dehydratase